MRRAGTRTALLEAAARLFGAEGYDAVSVDAVAQAAGRTSGAVYDHFGSKQGLLVAVLDEGANSLMAMVTAHFQEAASLHDRLRAVAVDVIVRPSPRTRRLLLLEHELALRAARDPEVASAWRRRRRLAEQRLVEGLQRWKADGLLAADSTPAADMACTVRALVLGMEMEQRLDPSAFDVETAASLLEAALGRPATSPSPDT